MTVTNATADEIGVPSPPALTRTAWAMRVLDLRVDRTVPLPQSLPPFFATYEVRDRNPDPGCEHLNGWVLSFHAPGWETPVPPPWEVALLTPPPASTKRPAAVAYGGYDVANDGVAAGLGLRRVSGQTILRATLGTATTFGVIPGQMVDLHRVVSDPETWLGPDPLPETEYADALRNLPGWAAATPFETWAQAAPWVRAGFDQARHAVTWRRRFRDDPQAARAWSAAGVPSVDLAASLQASGWTPGLGRIALLAARAHEPHLEFWEEGGRLATVAALTHPDPDGATLGLPERVAACYASGMTIEQIRAAIDTGEIHHLDLDGLWLLARLRLPLEPGDR